MHVQYRVGRIIQPTHPAGATIVMPRIRAARPANPVPPKRGVPPARRAIAVAVLIAAAGCATLDPEVAKAWKIEPMQNVMHTLHSSQAYYTLGRYHDGARAWDKAIDAYRKAIATDAQNIEAYNALGVALARGGRYRDAETTLRQATALAPELAHVRSNLGYVLLLAGMPREAVVELKAAVAQDSGNATAQANLTDALAQLDATRYRNAAVVQATARQPVPSADAGLSDGPPPAPAARGNDAANGVAQQPVDDAVGTISVAAPITSIEVPAPLVTRVNIPLPSRTVAVPAPQSPATRYPPLLALKVVDQPTVSSLGQRIAGNSVGGPVPVPAAKVAAYQPESQPAEELATRLEVSNGNGVAGMAARVGRWLATQGVPTSRLTNARPFVQQATVIQYRDGHEQAALRVARNLPVLARAAPEPTPGLHSDVRVLLGRDWMRSAACLETSTCRPVLAPVAAVVDR